MFLLDTNVLSELRKVGDGRADDRVTAWISGQDAASLYISVLTLMELEIGILRIERRDAEQGSRLRGWMDRHVMPEFEERTLPVDSAIALKCARLHVPDPRGERGSLTVSAGWASHEQPGPGNDTNMYAFGAAYPLGEGVQLDVQLDFGDREDNMNGNTDDEDWVQFMIGTAISF